MKKLLRKKAKLIRNSLDSANVSVAVLDKISNWDIFTKSCNIMLYYPIKNEINLLGILKNENKNFFFPKITQNDEICIVKYTNLSSFEEGKYNIKEPCCDIEAECRDIDLIFIPALMADSWGYRLGYGKGYYDKFLPKLPARTLKAIPVYEELFCEELPICPHDVKADYVILPDKIVNTKILLS